MMDIHCHILPGVDDGSKDTSMTREMLARAADVGITAVISTPHVYRPQQLVEARRVMPYVRSLAHEQKLVFGRGCEFSYRALMSQTKETSTLYEQMLVQEDALELFCLAGTHSILLELSGDHLFPDWEVVLTQMAEHGYEVIIAHPERYAYIQRDMGVAEEMISYGCELQLDAGGLMANMFSAERRTARRMLERGMASYIASDAHRPEDYAVFEKAYQVFGDQWPRSNRLRRALAHR